MSATPATSRDLHRAAHVQELIVVLVLGAAIACFAAVALLWLIASTFGAAVVVLTGVALAVAVIVIAFAAFWWTERTVAPHAASYRRTVGEPGTTRRVRTADGTELHVEIEGPPDATTTVVFLHGWMVDLDSWKHQRTMLVDSGVQRVFYDMRGHGHSAWRPFNREHPGVHQLVHDLRDVVTAVAPSGRLVLVGHSAGGMAIIAAAARHPDLFERVDATLLCATTAAPLSSHLTLGLPRLFTPAHLVMRRYAAAMFLLLGQLPRPLTRIFGIMPWAIASRFMACTHGSPGPVVAHTGLMMFQTHLRFAGESLHSILAHDEQAACTLPMSRTNVTCIAPERDRLIPYAAQKATAASIPGGRFVSVPRSGHMVASERPDVVNAELNRLLDLVAPNRQRQVAHG